MPLSTLNGILTCMLDSCFGCWSLGCHWRWGTFYHSLFCPFVLHHSITICLIYTIRFYLLPIDKGRISLYMSLITNTWLIWIILLARGGWLILHYWCLDKLSTLASTLVVWLIAWLTPILLLGEIVLHWNYFLWVTSSCRVCTIKGLEMTPLVWLLKRWPILLVILILWLIRPTMLSLLPLYCHQLLPKFYNRVLTSWSSFEDEADVDGWFIDTMGIGANVGCCVGASGNRGFDSLGVIFSTCIKQFSTLMAISYAFGRVIPPLIVWWRLYHYWELLGNTKRHDWEMALLGREFHLESKVKVSHEFMRCPFDCS